MATITTQLIDPMASKRIPLANVPNAINSPYRNGSAKRLRAEKEHIQEQPPAKKQLLDYRQNDEENVDPKIKVDDFFKKRSNAQPTELERRLAAAREKKSAQKIGPDSMESIRQWQRHYRRQFPQFVFYFDGVADELRLKLVRQLQSLGAHEEKFFSSAVTHVITTRPIPDTQSIPAVEVKTKTTTMIENCLLRRDGDMRRVASQAADVLIRARELSIKIWALEKVQRVLKTMLEAVTGEQGPLVELRQPDRPQVKAKEADLEQLLRNEKINGHADRDMTVAAQDMVAFKGCYLYIHDMEEKTKPVMIRDYPKPQHRDQGKWPQFRISSIGRCPFLEDPSQAEDAAKVRRAQREAAKLARDTPAEDYLQPLTETQANLRRSPRKTTQKPLDPPRLVPAKRTASEEMPAVFGSAQMNVRGLPRMIGGMPIASGMQQSNVTSAIRSQAISSAAISSTAPGMRRLPDSKEVSVLKRKVLERTTSVTSQPPSSYMNDMRAAINEDAPPMRAAKRKAQENILGVVQEEEATTRQRRRAKKSKVAKDPKPGYCENCRDKFDDFDEHCTSRKHQRFARTAEHWKDLDDLLKKLKRPHKEES